MDLFGACVVTLTFKMPRKLFQEFKDEILFMGISSWEDCRIFGLLSYTVRVGQISECCNS